ncbi:adenosine deaminase [Nannizzia gypsea CBS 118893]|uniref:Adenosine deaminase n=1 Tax=Arthroderma gypseum (strain ATCC MYA-4604 / CBS 118893) TaxID=535722 RepID=E4UYE9_ARTGP|nr:adenosine deaminase [Nannizzia gypsea CBS 118893]EFR02112.1 adenosine deaminase [Nannizzia gypsea CBS 118893]
MGDTELETAALASHFAARDALISKELSLRSDTGFRNALSPIASQACAIVSRIREAEHASIWKHDPSCPDNEAGVELYPGMMFGLAKRKLESTHLWKIAKRMPKGTLLHCHLGAMVEVDWLFERILDVEGMHVCSSEALDTEAARDRAVVLFKYITPKPGSSSVSIWSSEYQPNTYVPAAQAANAFPSTGRQGFVDWLSERSVISEQASIEHHLGVDEVWRKMAAAFPTLGSLLGYEPVYRLFIRKMLQTLAADGVRWVEIRDVFGSPFAREGQDVPEPGFNYRVAVMGEEIEAFKKTEEGKYFWGGRIIWTAFTGVECRIYTHQYEALPGSEKGISSSGSRELMAQSLVTDDNCTSQIPNIPFVYHAGECLGDGIAQPQPLRRYPAQFPTSWHGSHSSTPTPNRSGQRAPIMIESCPISNEVLRLTATVLAHPLPALLARGVSASLSNDDPALLGQGTSGMSHDFWQAVQAWENLGLAGLGSLAENSVRYAAFEDEDEEQWVRGIDKGYEGGGVKAERLKQWRDEWEAFCQWIVDEYGVEYCK